MQFGTAARTLELPAMIAGANSPSHVTSAADGKGFVNSQLESDGKMTCLERGFLIVKSLGRLACVESAVAFGGHIAGSVE